MSTLPIETMTRESSLLLIDLQEKFIPAMSAERIERALASSGILIELAHEIGASIVYTEQYPKGLGPTVSPLRERLEAIDAMRVEKLHFDACRAPAFRNVLDTMGPRVFVCGIEAHICVRATVHSLRSKGMEVVVPVDAVASRRDDDRSVGIQRMREMGAVMTATESVVFDTLGCAEGDVFKRFSRLVR